MIRDCLQILVLLALAWLVYDRTAADGPVSFAQASRLVEEAADELPQARRTLARLWAQPLRQTSAESRRPGLAPEITGGDIAAYLQGRPARPAAAPAARLKNRKSS